METARNGCIFKISIHAPVKGATARPRSDYRHRHDFNPRSREGSDPSICACLTG